jgi:hypothetical protein
MALPPLNTCHWALMCTHLALILLGPLDRADTIGFSVCKVAGCGQGGSQGGVGWGGRGGVFCIVSNWRVVGRRWRQRSKVLGDHALENKCMCKLYAPCQRPLLPLGSDLSKSCSCQLIRNGAGVDASCDSPSSGKNRDGNPKHHVAAISSRIGRRGDCRVMLLLALHQD